MTTIRRIALVALVLLLAASATGCRRVLLDESQRRSMDGTETTRAGDSADVDLESARKLDARIGMGAGQLTVSGGAEEGKALSGEFDYSRAAWEPRVGYRVEGSRGILRVVQGPMDFDFGDARNEWDLRLPSDVPLRLDLELGAGESDLDLTGMQLEELEVDLGAGEATIDLSGEWTNDLKARIEAGVGRLEIRVPAGVGVRLVGDRDGIGEFRAEGFSADGDDLVNDAIDTADNTLEIEINQGVGEIVVETVE